jgi:outer membrane lipoprotein-sorting protein
MQYLRSDRLNCSAEDVEQLVPTIPDHTISRAIVWLDRDDALPRRLEITERMGGTRTITLARLRPDAAVADSTFVFNVPPGVHVISQ